MFLKGENDSSKLTKEFKLPDDNKKPADRSAGFDDMILHLCFVDYHHIEFIWVEALLFKLIGGNLMILGIDRRAVIV